jgi:hypothetical protein
MNYEIYKYARIWIPSSAELIINFIKKYYERKSIRWSSVSDCFIAQSIAAFVFEIIFHFILDEIAFCNYKSVVFNSFQLFAD